MYGLPNPAVLLEQSPPTKESWKGDVSAAINSYHEKQLKEARANYSKIEDEWLHVGKTGLQACRLPEQVCSGSVILSWTASPQPGK